MTPEFSPNTPIYLQIMSTIKQKIVSGEWQPGTRIPPVRELSVAFGVNPNTAQRSLMELEREGLLFTERTTGRFVTEDVRRIKQAQAEMAEQIVSDFLHEMTALGFSREEIQLLVQTGEEENAE